MPHDTNDRDDGGAQLTSAQRQALDRARDAFVSVADLSVRYRRRVKNDAGKLNEGKQPARVKLYKQETGEDVGEITRTEAMRKLAEHANIALEAAPEKRPTHVPCERCGKPIAVLRGPGKLPSVCRYGCGRQETCGGWGESSCAKTPPARAFSPPKVRQRGGDVWRCNACAKRHAFVIRGTVDQSTCAGTGDGETRCAKRPESKHFCPAIVARRNGAPWRCKSCAAKLRHRAKTAAQRTAFARLGGAFAKRKS